MTIGAAPHNRANDDSRARLRALISRLDRGKGAATAIDGWSVAALLAHLSFWDRFTLRRWRGYLAGTVTPALGQLDDVINDAALPIWNSVPPDVAAREVLEAADAVDAFVAALSPEAVAATLAEGRERWIFRSLHRVEHLEQIERAHAL
jgi:hypothetical protein